MTDISRTTEEHSQTSSTLQLAGVLLLALIFRLFLLQYRWAVGFDEPHYLRLAVAGVTVGWQQMLHPYWPPMYPACIALFSIFFKDFELAARMVSVVTGTLIILPIYYLARDLYNRHIALLASLALALLPPLAFAATNVLTESLYTLLASAGMLLGWKALQKKSWWRAFLTGLLFGMAYLAKPEGTGYLLVFVGFAAAFFVSEGFRQRRTLVCVATTIVGFVVIASPYLFYLRQQMGEWSISMKFQANQQFAALGWTPDKDPKFLDTLTKDNRVLPTDLAYHSGNFQIINQADSSGAREKKVRIGLGLMVHKVVENFYKVNQTGIPGFLTLAPLLLMVLGLFKKPWTARETTLQLYLLSYIAFFWFVLVPFFHINPRYFLPLLPICFIWIGKGMVEMYEWIRTTFENIDSITLLRASSSRRYLALGLVVSFLMIFSYLPELGKIIQRQESDADYWADAVELKKAGQWLKANTQAPPTLMSYNKAVDFYSGGIDLRKGASFPANDDFSRILDYARYKEVEYMVISERYKSMFPHLQFLIDSDNVPPDLELVYKATEPNGIRTVIYRVLKPKGSVMDKLSR